MLVVECSACIAFKTYSLLANRGYLFFAGGRPCHILCWSITVRMSFQSKHVTLVWFGLVLEFRRTMQVQLGQVWKVWVLAGLVSLLGPCSTPTQGSVPLTVPENWCKPIVVWSQWAVGTIKGGISSLLAKWLKCLPFVHLPSPVKNEWITCCRWRIRSSTGYRTFKMEITREKQQKVKCLWLPVWTKPLFDYDLSTILTPMC